jgi:hypothetical protein
MNFDYRKIFIKCFAITCLVGGALLLGASVSHAAGAPDLIAIIDCVNESDRSVVRNARNKCDDLATGDGYNVGIFRPCNPSDECITMTECMVASEQPYLCFGAPGMGEVGCGPEPCEQPE